MTNNLIRLSRGGLRVHAWAIAAVLVCYGGRPPEADKRITNASALDKQAERLEESHQYAQAINVSKQALALRQQVLGANHIDVAENLNTLGLLYQESGDLQHARAYLERAVTIARSAGAAAKAATAAYLSNLGTVQFDSADYTGAEKGLQEALALQTARDGQSTDSEVATTYNNLGEVYQALGRFQDAEANMQRSLQLREASGSDDLEVASSLNNLGGLKKTLGDYEHAEKLYLRALGIRQSKLGAQSLDAATVRSNLGSLYDAKGEYVKAEKEFTEVLAIRKKLVGEHHFLVARSLSNLGAVYQDEQKYQKALELYQQALVIREDLLGPMHPDVAVVLNNMGWLFREEGDYTRAEPLLTRALSIWNATLGADHPLVAFCLSNLGGLYWAQGAHSSALEAITKSEAITERYSRLILSIGSESEKAAYLRLLQGSTDTTISFHVLFARDDPAALDLAFETVLRRKGRVLDTQADEWHILRNHSDSETRTIMDRLRAARTNHSALIIQGLGQFSIAAYRSRIESLEREEMQFEQELSRRSERYRLEQISGDKRAVANALPPSWALAEFVRYQAYDGTKVRYEDRWLDWRYAVYVLRRDGTLKWVDLGEASLLDETCLRFRKALRSSSEDEARRFGRILDERVMRPVRSLAGDVQRFFISPDGQLNLVPYGALVDDRGHYLIENYTFLYVTSGRDLLRLPSCF